jgi:hypothetical protein
MNLKDQKLIRTLLRVIRTLKKSFIIRRESRRRGGTSERNIARANRFATIKKEKYKIREDMVRSWGLGEIRPPSQKEKDYFFLYYHFLTWSYLIETKKKYWNL